MSDDLTIKVDNSKTMQYALMEIVKREDIDPDRLEKFLDLQIKMEERQHKAEFQMALSEFQRECPIIKKTKKVNFKAGSGKTTKYDYAALDEIVYIIKPILAKYGLSYSFDIKKGEEDNEMITTIYHSSGHQKDFSHFYKSLHDDSRMNQSQRIKSAITFAKRAALENALGIVTANEDDDARRAIDTPLSDEQLEKIQDYIEKSGAEEQRILDYYGVSNLYELSENNASDALKNLKAKRAMNAKQKGITI